MLKNRRGNESVFNMSTAALVFLILIVIVALVLIPRFITTPVKGATTCEKQKGVWLNASCNTDVSSPYFLATSKDHEKETCCVPVAGKEEEFIKWAKTAGAALGSSDVTFKIGSLTATSDSPVKVDVGAPVNVSLTKNTVDGDFCIVNVYAAQISGGKTVPIDSKTSFKGPFNFASCGKDFKMTLEPVTFTLHAGSTDDDKGLYIVQVDIYETFSDAKVGTQKVYVKASAKDASATTTTTQTTTTETTTKTTPTRGCEAIYNTTSKNCYCKDLERGGETNFNPSTTADKCKSGCENWFVCSVSQVKSVS